MDSYRIEWKHSAIKELRKLPNEVISRVIVAIEDLATNPLPSGVVKLAGAQYTYRIRIGDYRVIYTINEPVLLIEIVRVRHRREVYR